MKTFSFPLVRKAQEKLGLSNKDLANATIGGLAGGATGAAGGWVAGTVAAVLPAVICMFIDPNGANQVLHQFQVNGALIGGGLGAATGISGGLLVSVAREMIGGVRERGEVQDARYNEVARSIPTPSRESI